MISNFSFNPVQAKKFGTSNFIQKSGAYIASFNLVRLYQAQSGAEMMQLSFTTQEQLQGSLNLCLTNKNGEPTFNNDLIQALMGCMRTREAKPVQGNYKDPKTGNTMNGIIVPELMNKPVGLLIQVCPREYLDQNNAVKIAKDLEIVMPYCADTSQTVSELLDKKPATFLSQAVAHLSDKELRKLPPQQTGSSFAGGYGGGSGFEQFDDHGFGNAQPANNSPTNDFADVPF